jgi:hypothetical protein
LLSEIQLSDVKSFLRAHLGPPEGQAVYTACPISQTTSKDLFKTQSSTITDERANRRADSGANRTSRNANLCSQLCACFGAR